MTYTISQVAEMTGISAYTLRYYDNEGLLPFLEKDKNGARIFKDSDLEWLELLSCMKETGMSIKDLRNFITLCAKGDDSLKERLEIVKAHKEKTEAQIARLQKHMEKINYKVWYYSTAVEAGTEAIHKNSNCEE